MRSVSSQIAALLLFGGFMLAIAIVIKRLASTLKFSMQDTGHGKEVHVRTPIATLDVLPQTQIDPRLAKVPVYPGATPLIVGVADYDAQLHLLHRDFHEITANYATSSSKDEVCEFYRHLLHGWTEQNSGTRCTFGLQTADGTQKVVVMAMGDRTYIATGVSIRSSSVGMS